MNVFISWSGTLSKAFAELLHEWLPDVIQRAEPWLSSEDIDKGSIWSTQLNEALSTTVGVLCVTEENKNAPWLLFEAGALSKGLTKSRVCPLLIDLSTKNIQPPLSLLNVTLPEKKEMLKLVDSINAADPDNALKPDHLKKAFEQQWKTFEEKSEKIRQEHKTRAEPTQRSDQEIIAEVLENTRAIRRVMERVESQESVTFPSITGVTPPGFGTTLESRFLNTGKSANIPPHANWAADDLLNAIAELRKQAERGKTTDAEKPKNKGLDAYRERLKKSENETPHE
jgi:TIR domain